MPKPEPKLPLLAPLPVAELGEEERIACLRLIRSENVGPVTFRELINHFGGAQAALAARAGAVATRRARHQASARATTPRPSSSAPAQPARVPLFTIEPGYPAALAVLDAPPPLLYVKGRQELLNRPIVAIVGSRQCSAAGAKLARHFAAELARAGYVVASGLARGIDSVAHEAALEHGTVAVLAGGIDVVYPPENAALQEAIGAARLPRHRDAVRLRAARQGLSPPQPHHLRHRARRADRRGGAPLRARSSPRASPPSRGATCSPCPDTRSIRARKAPTSS